MSAFDDMIAADALEHIKALGAELIPFTARNAAARDIYVLIDRTPPVQIGSSNVAGSYVDAFFVSGDNTNGVTAPKHGIDRLTFKQRQSDDNPQDWIINEIVSQDAGLWHVRILTNR